MRRSFPTPGTSKALNVTTTKTSAGRARSFVEEAGWLLHIFSRVKGGDRWEGERVMMLEGGRRVEEEMRVLSDGREIMRGSGICGFRGK